jgi:hypothetical protein
MNDEQKTALARRLASLTPQDFQAVISSAKGQRIRTNQRPIPKKTEAKFLTAMKILRKGKQIKIPLRIEGYFDVSVGMADDSDHVTTRSVKLKIKSGFLGEEIKHHLLDAFWEADESDYKDLKIYHAALTDAQNLNSDLYEKVKEACENYGQDFFEYWENLLVKAELALK